MLIPHLRETKDGHEGNVGGVAPDRDPHQPLDWGQAAGVDKPPTAFQPYLNYGMEVGRIELPRIGGHKARRNTRRPSKAGQNMREVATNALAGNESVDTVGRTNYLALLTLASTRISGCELRSGDLGAAGEAEGLVSKQPQPRVVQRGRKYGMTVLVRNQHDVALPVAI